MARSLKTQWLLDDLASLSWIFFRHFFLWMLGLVGVPFGLIWALPLIAPVFPAAQFLAILPLTFLVTPPALIFGRPHFHWTEFGFTFNQESWFGGLLVLAFWIAVCLILAAGTFARTLATSHDINDENKDDRSGR